MYGNTVRTASFRRPVRKIRTGQQWNESPAFAKAGGGASSLGAKGRPPPQAPDCDPGQAGEKELRQRAGGLLSPLPLGGRGRGRASRRDGRLPGFARRFRWRESGPSPNLSRLRERRNCGNGQAAFFPPSRSAGGAGGGPPGVTGVCRASPAASADAKAAPHPALSRKRERRNCGNGQAAFFPPSRSAGGAGGGPPGVTGVCRASPAASADAKAAPHPALSRLRERSFYTSGRGPEPIAGP